MASEKALPPGGDDADGHPEAATALTTSQAVLQHFWDMASYDEAVRVSAARGLIKDLVEDQSRHAAALAADTEPAPEDGAPKIKQLEYHLRRCSPTMVYTLRRLARGLGSSRQAARQGYATALAGLLSATRCVTAPGVLVLLEVCIDGPLKGGDAKDTLLARIFGFGALLRSGLPLEPSVLSAVFNGLLDCAQRKSFLRESAVAVALEAAQRLDREALGALTAPGQPLASMLAAAPSEATPEALLLALVLWPKLPPAVVRGCRLLPAKTPPPPPEIFTDGSSSSSSAATAAAAAATAAGLFSREHLQLLLPVLLATSGSHPRMHTLWQYLLPLLLPGFTPHRNMDLLEVTAAATEAGTAAAAAPEAPAPAAASGGGKKAAKAAAKAAKAAAAAAKSAEGKGAVTGPLLESFWGVVVEGGLMDSSHERRYLGFQLFSRVLPHLRPEHVGVVFSPAFTRTLAGSVKKQENYLHASARKLLDGLSAFLERSGSADSGVKMAVAAALQRLGGLPVRQLTASKLTQKLVQGLDAEGVHRYVTSLMESFLGGAPPLQPGEGLAMEANGHGAGAGGAAAEAEAEAEVEVLASDRRGQCLEQLVAAVKFPSAAPSDSESVLRFLALQAFAQVQPGGKAAKSKLPEVAQTAAHLTVPLTAATRATCASRLVSLLTHISHAAQAKLRTAQQQQQQQHKGAEGDNGGGGGQPAAKKRRTTAGSAAAPPLPEAAAAAAAPPPSAVHQHLHDTLSYIHKVLKAPGVSAAAELGEEGEAGLALLAAVEGAAMERLGQLDKAQGPGGQPAEKDKGPGAAAARLRALAALAAHLQLQLLADPAGFEMDLPISLRRVAAEGLGLEGLPEVEEEEEAEEAEEKGGKKEGAEDGKPAGSWSDVLVDVMLALMARPGGSIPVLPLREAAESLWRQCCEGLSGEGLADIVRVVAAGGKGEGQDAAGLFESDDEDEEEEEEGSEGESDEEEDEEEKEEKRKAAAAGSRKRKGGSGSESDEPSDEEEEEEEEEEGGKEKAKKADGSKKDEVGSEEEQEEEDDDDMDDEAMFRMDEKLAAYFRTMVGGRAGGAAAAERAAALVNFRLRALGLLESYAKKFPNSPLLLAGLVPLLRALATASRPAGQPEVANRLRGVLNNRLSKCRCRVDLALLGGLEGYRTALKRLLYEASRNRDKQVAGAAWQAFTAVLRAGAATDAEPEAAEAAQSAFLAALTDLLTKKKTRLQPEGLAAAFRAAPAACLPSLEVLLHHVAAGRNAAVRATAAELLAALFRAPPEGLAAAVAAAGATGAALGGALAACAAGVGLKAKHHARAAKAAVTVAEALKRMLAGKRPAEVLGSDKVNAIAKAVVTVQGLGVASKVDKSLKRLVEVMALGPLLEKTKSDPALASRIQKARPDPAPAGAATKGKEGKAGKEAKEGKEGKAGKEAKEGKGGKAAKVQVEEKGKGKKALAGKKRKEEEEEAGSGSDAEVETEEGSASESRDEEPGSSGREEEEEEGEGEGEGESDDEDSGSEDSGADEGRQAGKKRGRGGGGAGRGGRGGRGRGRGGRAGGGRGKKPQQQKQPRAGGNAAKKVRR